MKKSSVDELQDAAICYALDGSRRYRGFVRQSVSSLRKLNRSIKVYLFCYGALPSDDRRFFQRHRIVVFKRTEQPRELATFLKWLSLDALHEKRVLFVDADTAFYQDPAVLFRTFNEKDFYARREVGTSRPHYPAERFMTRYQIKDRIFSALRKKLQLRRLPVFNTGVMLFNRASHRRFSSREFMFYYALLKSRKVLYPSTNSHIIDEIVAALVMGGMRSLTYGFFNRTVTPWYREIMLKKAGGFGAVVHIGSADYRHYARYITHAASRPPHLA